MLGIVFSIASNTITNTDIKGGILKEHFLLNLFSEGTEAHSNGQRFGQYNWKHMEIIPRIPGRRYSQIS